MMSLLLSAAEPAIHFCYHFIKSYWSYEFIKNLKNGANGYLCIETSVFEKW
jgi:hypothetical protein